MKNPATMGGGVQVGAPIVTADKVTWHTTTGTFELLGSGFSVNFQTGALTGTASSVTYSENGVVLASAAGMNLTSAQVTHIAQSWQTVSALIDALVPQDNVFNLSSGHDTILVGSGTDIVYGAGGTDTVVFDGDRSDYSISTEADSSIILTNGADKATLWNVERIEFRDGTLAFDQEGVAGQAYRLYQAAFDRTPDVAGLSFWVDSMDAGNGLHAAAVSFVNSAEFGTAYGTNLSTDEFVSQLYENVLGRAPDAAGIAYWVEQLELGIADRGTVLVGFAQSEENVDLVGQTISGGIWLQ